jgi:hypothetical protein
MPNFWNLGMAHHSDHRPGDLWRQPAQGNWIGAGRGNQRLPLRGQEGPRVRGLDLERVQGLGPI